MQVEESLYRWVTVPPGEEFTLRFVPACAKLVSSLAMNDSAAPTLARPDSGVRRVVLLYAVFAGLWVSLAETAMAWLFSAPAQRVLAGSVEGWLFVGVTAALLYGLVRRLVDSQLQSFASERAALQKHDRMLRLLHALSESSPDVIFAKDRDGRYLLFNREAARVTGHSAARVLGSNDRAIFPPEQVAIVRANDERVMAQDRPETFEEELDTADGRVTFLATKGPLHDAQGRVIGMFGISRDITQRHELERQTEAARAQAVAARDLLRDVLARIDDGFVALDRDGRYTYLNTQAARMLNREGPEVLLGRHIWTEYPKGLGQPFHRAYEQAMATQQPVVLEDHYAHRNRWFENRIYPSPDGLSIYFTDITARKRAEMALRERERDFRLLAEQMPAIIYRATLDIPPATLYVSPRIAELGYTPAQWCADAQAWSRTIHPDDRERVFAEMAAGLSHGEEVQIEYRMRDAAGRWRHYQAGTRRVRPDDGSAAFVQGVSVDITERVAAEAAQRKLTRQLQLALQITRMGVWHWDLSTDRITTLQGGGPISGLPSSAYPATGEAFFALVHTDDRSFVAARLRLARESGHPYSTEFRIVLPNRRVRWVSAQGHCELDPAARATSMVSVDLDITEHRHAEDALRESEGYRRNLFEQLGDGVLLLDRAARILDANPQALRMLGYPHEELLRLTVHDLLPEFEHARADQEVAAVMSGQPHLAEWEFVRSDGDHFFAEASARRLDERRFVAVVRDITPRHEAEKSLLAYQLELSELTHRLLLQEKSTTQRIAQALHDHLGQTLAAARLNLDACIAAHGAAMPAALEEQSRRIAALLEQAVREVRQVLAELRPPLLEDQGLVAALDNEIAARALDGGSADMLLEADDGALALRWPADVEYSAFMVAREAIANARQHAGASLIRVLLGGDAASLDLHVIDDGVGIPAPLAHGRPGHLGIVGMRERALAIGARFTVEPAALGGTRVTLRWQARPQ